MTTIQLLTAETLPYDDFETVLIADALTDLGIDSQIVSWTSPTLGGADLTVIRTTWDYTDRLAEFLLALDALKAPLCNPLEVVRWNYHKGYLVRLAEAGVPVVPTVVVLAAEFGSDWSLPDFGTPEIVVKPAVSAGGVDVGRFRSGDAAAAEHLSGILLTKDALVQPFQPEVMTGERSLVHLGGTFSHAVRKTPAAGDFRVHEWYGGVVTPHTPTHAELAVAQAALGQVPGGPDALTYARVDLVGPPDRPLVMELELIEPQLFLRPESAARFASVLAAALPRV